MFCVCKGRAKKERWEKEELLHYGKAAYFASNRSTWGGKFSVAFALGIIILRQLLTPTFESAIMP